MTVNAKMFLKDYKPIPKLITKETAIQSPRFPVLDAHTHLGEEFGGGWSNRPVKELLDVLDEAHVDILFDMDGGWGEDILQARLDKYKNPYPDRFVFFGGVDWSKWDEYGNRFGAWAAERLRMQIAWGAQGLKVWKNLGLRVRDQNGQLVRVDDARLDPIWETAGMLEIPVLIHVADPVAFFDPIDEYNERWEELRAHPDWQFTSPPYPSFMTIMEQFANLIERHPETNFIGAHVGCYAENLQWVGSLMNKCPNLYVDIAARLGELGRQPYTARKFFIDHADHILFGTDFPANVARYQLHYRFLETDDENFNYDLENPPTQGRWRIHGLFLPDDTLKKVYAENARYLIKGT